ncbi:10094_t:CDS:2 [Entrophospora sp. SA101]|nr:10094_t:CDS:2 [Entrophospora sp. SA101]
MSYVTTELISENQEEPNTFQEAEELEVDTELISEELLLTSLSESSFEDDMEEELLIDETLSPLEKISLYVRSELAFHRVFIAKEFPALIRDVEVSEALEYVLPLIISLGTDPEDHVKEAFATQLDDIIWFYYSHCTLREAADCSPIDIVDLRPPTTQISQTLQRPQTPIQHYNSQQTSSQTPSPANNTPYLSPSAFTFLLRALLLDQNTRIAQAAQATIQSLVERVLEELGVKSKKKDLLEKEILEGVVLGIGRLDQEKFRKEEINEWEHYGDEHGVSTVSGREEEAELGRITMMSLISSLAPIVGPERCTLKNCDNNDKNPEDVNFRTITDNAFKKIREHQDYESINYLRLNEQLCANHYMKYVAYYKRKQLNVNENSSNNIKINVTENGVLLSREDFVKNCDNNDKNPEDVNFRTITDNVFKNIREHQDYESINYLRLNEQLCANHYMKYVAYYKRKQLNVNENSSNNIKINVTENGVLLSREDFE